MNNPVKDKSYSLALKVISLYKDLIDQNEFVLSKQLIRAGTSIGANIEEALQGQSKKDFVSKLSISLKEAYETHYWLRLLVDSNFLKPEQIKPSIENTNEVIRLLTSIIKSSKLDLEKQIIP